jgi:tetratricopeptide (TPR) repeat protein
MQQSKALALKNMDTEILANLEQIKSLLVAILVIVSIILLWQVVVVTSRFLTKGTIYREKVFIHLASKHYDNGEYEELIRYSEEKIRKWGNNPYPMYWLARGHLKQGNLEAAKKLFEEVEEMEPEWRQSIEPYLAEINGR